MALIYPKRMLEEFAPFLTAEFFLKFFLHYEKSVIYLALFWGEQ